MRRRPADHPRTSRALGRGLTATVLFLTAAVQIAPEIGRAATLDVCPSGCTYSTIGAALADATSGDVVTVGAGTYVEQLTVPTNVTIAGDGAQLTSIDGGGNGTVVTVPSGVTTTISDVTITGGSSLDNGGGVSNAGTLTLEYVDVVDNSAADGGGGIFNTGVLDVADSTIDGNTGMLDGTGGIGGGGIATAGTSAAATIRNSTITNNSLVTPGTDQRGGGGIAAVNSDLTIVDSAIAANSSGYSSGGIYVSGSTAEFRLERSLVEANVTGTDPNRSTGRGGGISVRNSSTTTIVESAIIHNDSASSGGGVHADAAITIVNSTISNNSSVTAGGGIQSDVDLALNGVTVAANTAGSYGGGIYAFDQTVTADGVVVAGNAAATDGPDCYTTIAAAAGTTSLVGVTDATICVAAGPGTVLAGVDPLLGPLDDNGGPTLTHAPQDGSPLIDATVTSLTNDQRGEPRPSGLAGDIGAVEIQVATSAPPFELVPAWGGIGNDLGARAVTDETGACSWTPGETVDLLWDDPAVVLGSTTVDAEGCWELIVLDTTERIGGAQLGTHKVIASESASGDAQAAYELVERSFDLSPAIGPAERVAAVAGCGWGGATSVNVYWASTGDLIGRSIAVDAQGCLDGTATVPSVREEGLYAVVAADGAFPGPDPVGDASASLYAVRPATVFLTPPEGPPGGEVELNGCGWFPNEMVEFRSLADDQVFDVVGTVENGCFRSDGPQPVTMAIPTGASLGSQVIRATGADSGQEIDTPFNVLEPFIAFDPDSGAPGDEVVVTGCGWAGNTQVTVEWDYPDTNGNTIRWTHPVDPANGCLADPGLVIAVPANSPARRMYVTATGDVFGDDVAVFEVVSAGTMTLLQTEAEAGETVQVQIEDATIGEVIEFRLSTQFGTPDDSVGVATPDFVTDVDLPTDALTGQQTLYARGTLGFDDDAPLTILDTSTLDVVTSPLAANVLMEVVGAHWASTERVDLRIRPAGSQEDGTLLDRVTVADDAQEFSTLVRLPADLEDGRYELIADGSRGRYASVEIELISPTLTVSPPGTISGGSVDVTGTEWSPGELVHFSVRAAMSGAIQPTGVAALAAADGTIDDHVDIPFNLSDGSYELVAEGETGRSTAAPLWIGERTLAFIITEVDLLGSRFDPGGDTLAVMGDMYARLHVDAPGFSPVDVDFRDDHTLDLPVADPMWLHTFTVPSDAPRILPIEVSLYDWDEGADPATEAQADINPDPAAESAVLPVDLVDGTWSDGPIGQDCIQGDVVDTAVRVCFVTSVVSPTGDADADGFLDRWEMQGVDRNGDGVLEVDLPAVGFDPCRTTIAVDYASMQSTTSDYAPLPDSVASVVDAFDIAPIDAPTGCDFEGGVAKPGIDLLTDFLGREGYQAEYGCSDIAFDRDNRQDAFRRRLFHYAMFVDRLPGTSSSGVACGDGKIIISLGTPDSDVDRRLVKEASTFMHELGHALGLWHGGFENRNYKPNYLSVMNYRFQLAGQYSADGSRFVLDYSRERLPQLDESALTEEALTTADLETAWSGPQDPNTKVKAAANAPIDWNGDGPTPTDEPYGQDLNGDSWCVRPGDDDVLDTAPASDSDDSVESHLNSGESRIWAGPDGVCDTEADDDSDDEQHWGVGSNTWTFLSSHDDWAAIKLRARDNLRGAGVELDRIPEEPEPTVEQLDEQFELWFSPSLTVGEQTVTVTLGTNATNTGTYDDRDGDPVVLSASVGEVTDLGEGTWSWTHVPSEIGEQLVTVTASDDEGASSVSFLVVAEAFQGGSLIGAAMFEWPPTGDRTIVSVDASAPADGGEPTGSLVIVRPTRDMLELRARSFDRLVSGELAGGGSWVELSGEAVMVDRGTGRPRNGLRVTVRVEDRGPGDDLVAVEVVDTAGVVVETTETLVETTRGDLVAMTP